MELPPLDPESIAGKTLVSAPIVPAYSDRAWRAAEIPASNGHGNAHSAARVGSLLACGGEVDGVRLLSRATIDRALEEQSNDIDLVLGLPIRWGLGFGLASEKLPSLSPRSFYWGGFGGSWLEMDPEARMSFSYVMNKLEVDPAGDKRMLKVRNAVFSAMRGKK
jgi:CubicO group peptidase (beta-lactamase class C family)